MRRPPRPRRPPPGTPRAVEDDSPAPKSTPTAGPKLGPGSKLGRYVIQTTIGRGGMGVVYGAVDPKLGRRVAVKLVRRSTPTNAGKGDQYTTRLRREALALARLVHPNIVTIFDIGVERWGTFVAMEYVRGQNVRNWIREAARSWSEIVELFCEAGEGLAAAHAAGIVHRDFKPANVMITPRGQVKVLDFGLARGTRSEDPWLHDTDDGLLCRKLTRADTIVGTTGYMPPEQLLGREVDHRSDQFAFCVALFEALHGAKPYSGKNPIELARSYASAERNEIPLRKDIPPHVLDTIERGMSLEPTQRFANMDELLRSLRGRPATRRPTLRTAVGVLALVCTAFAASTVTAWLHGDDSTASAEACTVEASVTP